MYFVCNFAGVKVKELTGGQKKPLKLTFCNTLNKGIMNTTNKNESIVKNSNNLSEVEVIDNTTTKGKVSGNFNLNDISAVEEKTEKVDKNQLFSVELADYFCPVKFDASALENALSPLVNSGIMSEEAKLAAIDKAKKEYLEEHGEEVTAANNLSFAEVLAKLQENQTLYKKVLAACKVSGLEEANYIEDGKVTIYRANQCTDKDGNNRYTDCTLTAEENGKKFTVNLFVEYREITTGNILLAIRYYSSRQDAQKRLLNQLSDYRRILSNVAENVQKAKDNSFTKEQVLEIVETIFG